MMEVPFEDVTMDSDYFENKDNPLGFMSFTELGPCLVESRRVSAS